MIKRIIGIAILLIAIAIAIGWAKRTASLTQLQVNVSNPVQQLNHAFPTSLLGTLSKHL